MTTASSTKFSSTEVRLGKVTLFIEGNQKITMEPDSYEDPVPNALSVLAIEDCPDRTSICEAACYVANLKKHAPETYAMHRWNSTVLRRLMLGDRVVRLCYAQFLGAWIAGNCPSGFRWHVAGDVFSPAYADWIVQVCRASPSVQHWIYTRSFRYVDTLLMAENLTVNLSADSENALEAGVTYWTYESDARVCYLVREGEKVPDSLKEGSVIFPDYPLRGDTAWRESLPSHQRRMICPVDFFGKSKDINCATCRKCID